MTKQSDIGEAVKNILESKFPGCSVYADEVREGFKPPAFFVELIPATHNVSTNFNSNDLTITITYLPRTYTAEDNANVADEIKAAFGMFFKVGVRALKIDAVSFHKTGENKEILQVDISVKYFDGLEKTETGDKMNELHMRTVKEEDEQTWECQKSQ